MFCRNFLVMRHLAIYKPENDPMMKMTVEQRIAAKKTIEKEGRRVFGLAYKITAGSLGFFLV
jgi:hypothetical protein